jgi:ribosomal protein S18 acetylase RimI-like enzyme
MQLRALRASDFDAIHDAFTRAFADYVVPFQPSQEQLREMLTRRGWSPELSVAVVDAGDIVAFTLNGVEGSTAYDSGTGVVPTHRHQGLGRAMVDFCVTRLREARCTRWILEVIDANAAAVALYRANGFVMTRTLQSWTFTFDGPSSNVQEIVCWDDSFHDVPPSWQNSTAAVGRSRDVHIALGVKDGDALLAYAIVYPATGDVPQLAVRRDQRRRGLGRALLWAAAARAAKPLRLINIDASDAGTTHFLERCGALRLVTQFEMVRDLVDETR